MQPVAARALVGSLSLFAVAALPGCARRAPTTVVPAVERPVRSTAARTPQEEEVRLKCPMHGGVPAIPGSPMGVRRSAMADTSLLRRRLGALTFVVRDVRDDSFVHGAYVRLDPIAGAASPGRSKYDIMTKPPGAAHLEVPAGTYMLTTRRIGYAPSTDSLVVRSGFRDSVSFGLGQAMYCLS